MSEPRLVPIDRVPVPEVLALLRLALGEGSWGRSPELWSWKHLQSPFGSSPGLAALADDGTLAAVRMFQRWQWSSDGHRIDAVRAVDTATHPDWRRRGLFRRLTLELVEQMSQQGARLVFNTPNRISGAGYLAMGWRPGGRAPLWVRPLRPLRLAAALLRRDAESPSETPSEPTDAGRQRPNGTGEIDGLLAEPALVGFLGGWGEGERRLITPRSPRYLAWRYRPPAPGPGYGAVWELTDDRGFVVVARRGRRRGLEELMLCEILVHGGEAEIGGAAAAIDKLVRASGAAHAVALAAGGTAECAALARARFWSCGRRGPRWVVRPLAGLADSGIAVDPTDAETWRLAAGDLELF